MYMCVSKCGFVYMTIVSMEARKGYGTPWIWSYRQLIMRHFTYVL